MYRDYISQLAYSFGLFGIMKYNEIFLFLKRKKNAICHKPNEKQKVKSISLLRNHGEMSELAEGARLEIACTAKSGTGGSNPPLSATKYSLDVLGKSGSNEAL